MIVDSNQRVTRFVILSNVQFLLYDNGISWISSISFKCMQTYCLCRIWCLVCTKMCCKNFENWLTIEKVMPENNFE